MREQMNTTPWRLRSTKQPRQVFRLQPVQQADYPELRLVCRLHRRTLPLGAISFIASRAFK